VFELLSSGGLPCLQFLSVDSTTLRSVLGGALLSAMPRLLIGAVHNVGGPSTIPRSVCVRVNDGVCVYVCVRVCVRVCTCVCTCVYAL
jgi:hypothetical protein